MTKTVFYYDDPNWPAQSNDINRKKTNIIIDKKYIQVHGEITIDYIFETESKKSHCRCGAYNCLGHLN